MPGKHNGSFTDICVVSEDARKLLIARYLTNNRHQSTEVPEQGRDEVRYFVKGALFPTQDITQWRVTLLVSKISGQP